MDNNKIEQIRWCETPLPTSDGGTNSAEPPQSLKDGGIAEGQAWGLKPLNWLFNKIWDNFRDVATDVTNLTATDTSLQAQITALTTSLNTLRNQVIPSVGEIYITQSTTENPATKFGVGTWQKIAVGRTLFGQDTNISQFDTVGKTGGSVNHAHFFDVTGATDGHVLTIDEMPSHVHEENGSSDGGSVTGFAVDTNNTTADRAMGINTFATGGDQAHSHDINLTGLVTNNSGVMPPYEVVIYWKRTA